MSHRFTTADWEELDSMFGINPPARHIWVQEPGFQLRKKVAGIGVGTETPSCVNYGGIASALVTTVEAKGKPEQIIRFLQGVGGCE